MASKATKSRKKAAESGPHRRPTILDVARLAHVGAGTVSRVINNNPSVTPEMRQSVESAIAQLGYEPDVLARSMRHTQAREVGFIFKNVSLARMTPFLNGVNAVLDQAGSIMVLGLAENSEAALAHLRSFGQHRIDEVLLALSEDPDPEILNSINQMHLNAVFVNQVPPSAQRGILVDFHTGTIEALRCLIGFGHRRVALLASNNHSYIRKSVIDGYVEGHKGAGLPVDPDLIRTMGARIETAAAETSALLAKENAPTAFIVSSDAVLAGAARAVQSKGLTIGRDVSFITMGDSDLADLMTPAITAIRWDVHEMGRLAAMLLLDGREIAGPAPRPVLVPFEIVLRQSCQPVSHGKT